MTTARLAIDPHVTVAPVNRRIFGSFVEHLGRCVYDGIYEPGHPTADADGFRLDVLELVKELGVDAPSATPAATSSPATAGRTASARARTARVRRDLAWHSLETNQVGARRVRRAGCKLTGTELMMAVNLGTRGIEAALDLLEYSNHPSGTALATSASPTARRSRYGIKHVVPRQRDGRALADRPHDRRRLRQARRPHRPGDEGRSTRRSSSSSAARPAPRCRPSATGSAPSSSTATTHVDYISCHAYYQERDGDLGSFLASSLDMEYFIDTVVATADHVQAQAAQRQADPALVRRVERLVPRRAPGLRRGHDDEWRLRARACSRTSTRSPMRSCSATC